MNQPASNRSGFVISVKAKKLSLCSESSFRFFVQGHYSESLFIVFIQLLLLKLAQVRHSTHVKGTRLLFLLLLAVSLYYRSSVGIMTLILLQTYVHMLSPTTAERQQCRML